MKAKRKIRPVMIIGVASILTLCMIVGVIVGLRNANDETKRAVSEWWEKIVFDKTIDDFPGHMIDNLDEDPTTNFIVYAEGVKRVSVTQGVNQVLSADNEELVYHIGNPDEQIIGLQKGDVFFIEPNEYYAYGLSVKVNSITLQEDGALILGDELKLEDLIEYADVDMDFPVTTFYLEHRASGNINDNSEGHTDIQVNWVDGDETVHSQTLNMQQNAESVSFQKLEFPFGEWNRPGSEISTGFNMDWNNLHAEGRVGFRVSTVHCTFRVRPAYFTAVLGEEATASLFFEFDAGATAAGSLPIKFPSIIIPVAGPLVFNFTPGIALTAEGRIGISGKMSGNMDTEVELSYMPLIGLSTKVADLDFQYNEPEWNLKDVTGSITLELLKGTAKFGIPAVTNIYESTRIGAALEGTLNSPRSDWNGDTTVESVHICDQCVAGDVYQYGRLDVGLVLDFLNMLDKSGKKNSKGGMIDFDGAVSEDGKTAEMTSKDGDIYEFGNSKSWRLFDLSWCVFEVKQEFPIEKWAHFYISFRNNHDPEAGWGECPYHNWRTEVQIVDSNQQPVSKALVTATSQYGEEIEPEWTDDYGKVILYLPNGRNQLHSEHEGNGVDGEVIIEQAPTSATLSLKPLRKRLFVIYDFTPYSDHIGQVVPLEGEYHDHDTNWTRDTEFTYQELKEIIDTQYDVEKFISLEQWELAATPETRREQFDYLDSDCAINVRASRGASFFVTDAADPLTEYCVSFDWSGIYLIGWQGNKDLEGKFDVHEGVSSEFSSDSLLWSYIGVGSKVFADTEPVFENIGSTTGESVSFEFANFRDCAQNNAVANDTYVQLFKGFLPKIDQMLYGE